MTRPQKESYMKREHRITIRLTDTEFSIIENSAEQAYMSISEYMRKQIMEGYEHLALVGTVDGSAGLIKFYTTPDTYFDTIDILENMPFEVNIVDY